MSSREVMPSHREILAQLEREELRDKIAALEAENQRLRDLYENAVGNRERFGWTINHLLECEETLAANVAVQLGLSDALNERDAEIERLREENSRLHIAFTGQRDSLKRLWEERQAVLDCINLHGDETLHSALERHRSVAS